MERYSKSFEELSALGKEESVEAGRFLWREGDSGNEVVLLLEGVLDVVHEALDGDEIVLRSLEPGAIVGELASLDGHFRSAAVRAVTGCRVLRVPAAEFRDLVARRHDIVLELFWQQVDRVRSLTGRVTQSHMAAITDSLTGLYNFGFFRERLALEAHRACITGDPLSLVVFDIDHFKSYNDSFGHAAGNETLVKVASAIRTGSRRGDVVARYGGEEFVVLLYGATRDEAAAFGEQIRIRVENTAFGDGEDPAHVTISGGVATLPDDADGAALLFEAADINLYQAKESGRNRIVSDPRMKDSARARRPSEDEACSP
jgi:diguanylate cyclase (GGDEF)-like protein